MVDRPADLLRISDDASGSTETGIATSNINVHTETRPCCYPMSLGETIGLFKDNAASFVSPDVSCAFMDSIETLVGRDDEANSPARGGSTAVPHGLDITWMNGTEKISLADNSAAALLSRSACWGDAEEVNMIGVPPVPERLLEPDLQVGAAGAFIFPATVLSNSIHMRSNEGLELIT